MNIEKLFRYFKYDPILMDRRTNRSCKVIWIGIEKYRISYLDELDKLVTITSLDDFDIKLKPGNDIFKVRTLPDGKKTCILFQMLSILDELGNLSPSLLDNFEISGFEGYECSYSWDYTTDITHFIDVCIKNLNTGNLDSITIDVYWDYIEEILDKNFIKL